MSMDPYENVYLGNFVYALGIHTGRLNHQYSSSCIQMYAHTRWDEHLGDMYFRGEGGNHLFEFKRNKNTVKSELKKTGKSAFIRYLNTISPKSEDCDLSRRGHFLGVGEENGISFSCYMDIGSEEKICLDMNGMCESMLLGKDIGLNNVEFKQYLSALKRFVNDEEGGCGGFVVKLHDEGGISLLRFDDFRRMGIEVDHDQGEALTGRCTKGFTL